MREIAEAINEIIECPPTHITEEEAIVILQKCGVMDEHKKIKPEYADMVKSKNDKRK